MSIDERKRAIEICLEEAEGKVHVIPGTGTNSTSSSIELTKMAQSLGATGAMLITPYYNKPTPRGQVEHFSSVAREVDIPIVLYNVPGRTGTNMLPETVAELFEVDNIVAIKEASGSVDQVSAIGSLCDITILSGDDSLTLPMMSVGAAGVISVVANVAPRETMEMVDNFIGSPKRAMDLHGRLFPLIKTMFIETNPGPVKKALELMGLVSSETRLPLVPVTDGSTARIVEELTRFGIALDAGVRT
jgi:4-hydroxy-tetrahydrodipicolinate synthase